MGKISRFGLIELSRQRLQTSLGETSHIACPRCHGVGHIRGIESSSLHILRIIQEEAMKENTAAVHAQVPVDVATYLLNEKRGEFAALEARLKVSVLLIPNIHIETPNYTVTRLRHDELNQTGVLPPSYQMVTPPPEPDENLPGSASDRPPRPEAMVKGVTPTQHAPLPVPEPAPAAAPVPVPAAPVAMPPQPPGSFLGRILGWFTGPRPVETAPAPVAAPAAPAEDATRKPRDGQRSRRGGGRRDDRGDRTDRSERPTGEGRGPRPERATDAAGATDGAGRRGGRGGRGRGDRADHPAVANGDAGVNDVASREPRAAAEGRPARPPREPRAPKPEAAVVAEALDAAALDGALPNGTLVDGTADTAGGEERRRRRRGRRGGSGRRAAEGAAALADTPAIDDAATDMVVDHVADDAADASTHDDGLVAPPPMIDTRPQSADLDAASLDEVPAVATPSPAPQPEPVAAVAVALPPPVQTAPVTPAPAPRVADADAEVAETVTPIVVAIAPVPPEARSEPAPPSPAPAVAAPRPVPTLDPIRLPEGMQQVETRFAAPVTSAPEVAVTPRGRPRPASLPGDRQEAPIQQIETRK
jgi:ribonuclease E